MSLTLNAFEYHGLKSGMSKEEVQSILKCEYSSSCSFGDDDDPEDNIALDAFFGEIKPYQLKKISFAYTNDNKLWRIILKFEKPMFGIALPAGFKTALEEKYPDASLEEETDRSGYFTRTFYSAFLIDTDLFARDVKYWHDKWIQTF
tara:strand:+ start:1156 stop:1596 length:441 start_codon:yes stop_codon:yes gene_type:complete